MKQIIELLDAIEGKGDLSEVKTEWSELRQIIEYYLGPDFFVDIDEIGRQSAVPFGANRGSVDFV